MNAGMHITQSGLARGEVLAIEDETTWIRDIYRLQWDHNREQPLFLVVQLMEYGKGRQYNSVHEIQTEYSTLGYGLVKLSNPDATIRYGTYELEMYSPPINLTKQNPADKIKAKVKVTVGQPHFTSKPPSQQRQKSA